MKIKPLNHYTAITATYLAQNGLTAVRVRSYLGEPLLRYVNARTLKQLLKAGRILA